MEKLYLLISRTVGDHLLHLLNLRIPEMLRMQCTPGMVMTMTDTDSELSFLRVEEEAFGEGDLLEGALLLEGVNIESR